MSYFIFPKSLGENLELDETKHGLKISIGKESTYINYSDLKEYVERIEKRNAKATSSSSAAHSRR